MVFTLQLYGSLTAKTFRTPGLDIQFQRVFCIVDNTLKKKKNRVAHAIITAAFILGTTVM